MWHIKPHILLPVCSKMEYTDIFIKNDMEKKMNTDYSELSNLTKRHSELELQIERLAIGKFNRGCMVLIHHENYTQPGIFVCLSSQNKRMAEIYFENGNVWLRDVGNLERVTVKQSTSLHKEIKLKFHHMRNFRRNFDRFL